MFLSYSSFVLVNEFPSNIGILFLIAISPESFSHFKTLCEIPKFTLIKTNNQLFQNLTLRLSFLKVFLSMGRVMF